MDSNSHKRYIRLEKEETKKNKDKKGEEKGEKTGVKELEKKRGRRMKLKRERKMRKECIGVKGGENVKKALER